jgi:predicted nucleic acid-binding protein
MTFFLDANVLVYAAVGESRWHAAAIDVLEHVGRGRVPGRTSTSVLEEVWHLELEGRIAGLEGQTERLHTIFTPLLDVTDEAFRLALALDAPRLGANDRLHVGTCLAYGIDTIVTADAGFDGVAGIRRIDPLDGAGLASVLRA